MRRTLLRIVIGAVTAAAPMVTRSPALADSAPELPPAPTSARFT